MRILVLLVTVLLPQSAPAPGQCILTTTGGKLEGICADLLGEKPALIVAPASALKSGRYRKDASPTAIYTGEMKAPVGVVAIEIELYADGTGILRPDGLVWIAITKASKTAGGLQFTLDVAKAVPPSDLDREIIVRASAIISSEAVWDRKDDRVCGSDDKTWSIYCAMIRATEEVTGGVHHRRPAMEAVRLVVTERAAGRKYEHRLRDYNNDPLTTLADVRSAFTEALARLKR